jgi:hypothetical protein
MFPEKMPLKKSMKHMGLTPPRGKYPGIWLLQRWECGEP